MSHKTRRVAVSGHDGVGGTDAPQAINVVQYAGARAREMEAMASVSVKTWGDNKAMQTLPRHMRRRAASHNLKRLPRRLQDKGRREMHMERAGNPTSAKRPSRRHRRRPGNLLEEYSRRSRNSVWLETHIWHAKRFHMSTQWGYRIPLHPNDKGVRAAYRGATNFCIMRDTSFMCCIELRGPQATLLTGLLRLTSVETGPTPAAVRFLTGVREGQAVFFLRDQYPLGGLGVVKFLWRPVPPSAPGSATTPPGPPPTTARVAQRQVWLWCHPAVYQDLLGELVAVFELEKRVVSESVDSDVMNQDKTDNPADQVATPGVKHGESHTTTIEKASERKKTVDDMRPSALNAVCYGNADVTLTSLKDLLCRFNLSGPLSHSILGDLLKVADVKSGVKSTSEHEHSPSDMDVNEAKWWQRHFSCEIHSSLFSRQGQLWEELRGLQSTGELAENVVLGLTTRDPRIFLPRKKMRVSNDPAAVSEYTLEAVKTWPCDVADSPIWEPEVRREVKSSKLTEAEMNKLRTQHLVPGTELRLGCDESRVPVLLIQHPGPRPRTGRPQEASSLAGVPLQWSAGWDVILPQAWAMAFWVGLVYRGARACGMKESLSTANEMGQLHFPEGYPDTPPGRAAERAQRETLEGKYRRMPPAKRPNYVKLGTVAPFHHPWAQLVANWTGRDVELVVLRNKRLLLQLDELCSGQYRRQRPVSKPPPHKARKVAPQQWDAQHTHSSAAFRDAVLGATLSVNTRLVAVRVRALQRGVLEPFSTICLPTAEDLKTLRADAKYGGPLEPPHADHHHPKQPKSKRKSKAERTAGHQPSGDATKETASGDNDELNSNTRAETNGQGDGADHTKGLCSEPTDVRGSCGRLVFGQIKQGGYHFCEGRGAGIGFVVLEGLRSLLQGRDENHSTATTVLVRSPRSNQYRYGTLSIIS